MLEISSWKWKYFRKSIWHLKAASSGSAQYPSHKVSIHHATFANLALQLCTEILTQSSGPKLLNVKGLDWIPIQGVCF